MNDGQGCDNSNEPDGFDPIAYINEPRWQKVSLGLGRISALLDLLGNPHLEFKVIHVAGTNGKGSVCAYLNSILRESGCKVGLFTSPYIERFEERIQVDSRDIEYQDLLESTLDVRRAADMVERECGEHPTEFELMFAVAMLHFARSGIDIAVVEVGLGGRLDATNVVSPELCVITSISYDHTLILGDTLELIASEKAGIIKRGCTTVSYPQAPEAMEVIERRCIQADSNLLVLSCSDIASGHIDIERGIQRFSYRSKPYETRLLGSYQPANAALAILCAEALRAQGGYCISEASINEGVKQAEWPGRFEVIGKRPMIIVDGAHNPQGVLALSNTLGDIDSDDRHSLRGNVIFVMGVLSDKDYMGMVLPLLPFAKAFIVYTPENPRALDAADLGRSILRLSEREGYSLEVVCMGSVAEAMEEALQCVAPQSDWGQCEFQNLEAMGESHDGAGDESFCANHPNAGYAGKEDPESIIVAFGTLYSISEIKKTVCRLLK